MVVSLDGEIWKSFPEWSGLYEISNKGRVKSVGRTFLIKGGNLSFKKERLKVLTPNHKNKYLMVTLTDPDRHETICVHRIVAEVFIPNPLNLPEVNHKKTKNDITVDDLEWITGIENKRDAYARGLIKPPKGKDVHTARRVGKYLNGLLIKEYGAIIEAEEDGHETNAIRQAIINEWTHKGYNWKYLDGKTVTRKKRVNRKVGCFVDDELRQEYQDINKVVENGYDRRNIYRSLKDGKTTVKGFLWKYLD